MEVVHTASTPKKETQREWLYRTQREDREAFERLPQAEKERLRKAAEQWEHNRYTEL
jgi:hypothetical protein